MKMKLLKEKSKVVNDKELKFEVYEVGKYMVVVHYTDGKMRDIETIETDGDRYLPEINFSCSIEMAKTFRISTTSYGNLKAEEIKKVVEGYEHALEVVEVLTEKFL